MPSQELKRKIKTRFEIMSVPFYTVREDDTRRAKHGQNPWQYDHWKARDATKGAQKRKYRSILHRWQKEEAYQESESARGWTQEYCRYLDYLATVDISYVATWKERSKYENMLVLKLNDGEIQEHVKSI